MIGEVQANQPSTMASEPVSIFFSYSRKDEALMRELESHLEPLRLSRLIESWHDGCITPGEEWEPQIKENLQKAQIILLLISVNFISSKYCNTVELTQAIKRHKSGDALVIPLILKPCMWHPIPVGEMTLGELQALPKDALPVTSWKDPDEAYTNIAEGLYEKILQLQQERAAEAERQRQEAEAALSRQQEQEEAERKRREAERQEAEAAKRRQREQEEAECKRKEAEAQRQREKAERQRKRDEYYQSGGGLSWEIHEFSTGINVQPLSNDGWVSTGFTGRFMNQTLVSIPIEVERAIANQEFAVLEGSCSDGPAIIAKNIPLDNQTISGKTFYSVVAVVSKGTDEKGRRFSFYRYFICSPSDRDGILTIIKWMVKYKSHNQDKKWPEFDPLNPIKMGDSHILHDEERGQHPSKEFVIGKLAILRKVPPSETYIWPAREIACIPFGLHYVAKALSSSNPVSWAYNVEAIEKSWSFKVVFPSSEHAEEMIVRRLQELPEV